MTFDERLAAIRTNMIEQKLDLLVAIHDGAHFIETPNPVLVLSGFKSLGPAAVMLRRDGETMPDRDPGLGRRARRENAARTRASSRPTTWSMGSRPRLAAQQRGKRRRRRPGIRAAGTSPAA